MSRFADSQVVRGLRELADYIEANPQLPYSWSAWNDAAIVVEGDFITGTDYNDKEEKVTLATVARQMGKCEKDVSDYYFTVFRLFGEGSVKLKFESSRDNVCTKKVIGKTKKKERKMVTQPVYEDVEVEVDDVEYECPESLLRIDR